MIRSSEVRDAIRLVAKARKEDRKARPKITVARDGKQREPRIHDNGFLAFLRRQPCAIAGRGGHICDGPIQAAHLRAHAPGELPTGLQRKPNDQRCNPLCLEAHREQHDHKELAWWAIHGVNPFGNAAQLYAQYQGNSASTIAN